MAKAKPCRRACRRFSASSASLPSLWLPPDRKNSVPTAFFVFDEPGLTFCLLVSQIRLVRFVVSHDDVSRQLQHVARACLPCRRHLSVTHFNTMIITYPIELPYVAGNEQRVVPDTLFNNSGILSGPYLIGKNRFWHGGLHIHPIDRNAPIRAIADGELVAYRYDANDTSDAFFNQSTYEVYCQ